MYMFLFDDILLLTKVKKPPRKVSQQTFVDRLAACYCVIYMTYMFFYPAKMALQRRQNKSVYQGW